MNRRRFLVQASGPLVVLAAGCTDGDGRREGNLVHVDDVTFNPPRMEIDVGESVTWENVGSFPHTVTSATFHRRAADWEIDTELTDGETTSHTFDREGLYEYYCSSHGEANECGAVLVGDVSEVDDLPCDVV